MKSVSAFAPANISCVFKIHPDQNPRFAGSTGIGFTINKGVTVSVCKAEKQKIQFNNKQINFPTVAMVLQMLTTESISIKIETELPLGTGFGLSGASALACAYAVNALLDLKKTEKDLAIIAHTADAAEKTGLGDVVNQYFGGFLVKFAKSSEFLVERLPIVNIPVYCAVFSTLLTDSVLSDLSVKAKINIAANIAFLKVKNLLAKTDSIHFKEIIDLSEEFAITSGLLKDKKVKDVIEGIKKQGGHASMIMLGNAVFSDTPFPGATKYTIEEKGAYLL